MVIDAGMYEFVYVVSGLGAGCHWISNPVIL